MPPDVMIPLQKIHWILPVCWSLLLATGAMAAEISRPVISVREYGTVGDGITSDTAAVQQAVDACARQQGGTVAFPPGVYLCGELTLKSDTTLRLESGAVLRGSNRKADYAPRETIPFRNDADVETRYVHPALLFAENAARIAIVGDGAIEMAFTRRGGPKPIALKRCAGVTIRGIKILNAPNYAVSLLGAEDVLIDGIAILNAYADGIDPDSCKNVRIMNCHIESVDDAIVPKSSFSLGERRPSENIVVSNCFMATRCNGFKLGTESGGGFRQIAVNNCVITGMPGKSPALAGIALESVDGGILEGVVVSNITMKNVRSPLFLRLGNRGRDMDTPKPGALRQVAISNITAVGASMTCSIVGIPSAAIEQVSLSNIQIAFLGANPLLPENTPVPEKEEEYPETVMFGPMPAYAFYLRHIRGISLSGISVTCAPGFWRLTTDIYRDIRWDDTGLTAPSFSEPADAGHALWAEDVADLTIRDFSAEADRKGAAPIRLHEVRNAQIDGRPAGDR